MTCMEQPATTKMIDLHRLIAIKNEIAQVVRATTRPPWDEAIKEVLALREEAKAIQARLSRIPIY